jgi:glutathione S-transferase
MIQLHYYSSTASMVPHILLEEIGMPYERVLVDRTVGAHKAPAYLQLNPNGLIPVLTDGDLVLYETAAIVLHLCDTHPQARLAPEVGSAERAHFYKWLVWCTNTLQATLIVYFYPERWMDEGNTDGVAQLKALAER